MKKRGVVILGILIFISINLIIISAEDCKIDGCPPTGGWVCNDITGDCEKPCSSSSDCNDNYGLPDPCYTCVDNRCVRGDFDDNECGRNTCTSDADCNDGDSCTGDWCSPTDRTCLNYEVGCMNNDGCCLTGFPSMCTSENDNDCGTCTSDADCNDGNPCTTNSCNPSTGCSYTQIPGCGDGDCVPNCQGRNCGDDGCGGGCGSCSAGETCQLGQCEEPKECIYDNDCAYKCEINCECGSELGSLSLLSDIALFFETVWDFSKNLLGFVDNGKIEINERELGTTEISEEPAEGSEEETSGTDFCEQQVCTIQCPNEEKKEYRCDNFPDFLEDALESCPDYEDEFDPDSDSDKVLPSLGRVFHGSAADVKEDISEYTIKDSINQGKYPQAIMQIREVLKRYKKGSDKYQYFYNMLYDVYYIAYLENDDTNERDIAKSIINVYAYDPNIDVPIEKTSVQQSIYDYWKHKYLLVALAYEERGEYDVAEEFYRNTLLGRFGEETDVNSYIALARIREIRGDYIGALKYMEKAKKEYPDNELLKIYENQRKQKMLYEVQIFKGESIRENLEKKKEKLDEDNTLLGQFQLFEEYCTLEGFRYSFDEIRKRAEEKISKKRRELQGIKTMTELLEKNYDLNKFVEDIFDSGEDTYANEVIYDVDLPNAWNREDVKDRHYQPYKDFVLETITSKPGDIALIITNGDREKAIELIKKINPNIKITYEDYPVLFETMLEMGIPNGRGYHDPLLSDMEEIESYFLGLVDPLIVLGAVGKTPEAVRGALGLRRLKEAWKLGPGLSKLKAIEAGKFSTEEIARINKAINVLKEAGFTEKAELLSKSPEFQKALLKAHYTANNIEYGRICAKSRFLRNFLRATEQKPLFENWVVGKPEKLIRKINAETNGLRLADLADKIPGLKKVEGPTHYNILKNGVKITEIPRHTTLKKGTLISIRKILIAELGG